MSLWREPRRRNVFKVGAAYAVVAWLLVQFASIVLPAFDFPQFLFQAFLVLVAVGFVISVVLAWIYELTPDSLMREEDISEADHRRFPTGRKLEFSIIALLAFAVVFLLLRNRLIESPDGTSASQRRPL